ncbi:hypothetical protein [Gluconacetobacter asukensis]|uniref:Uncharacterized protein n=1 Tax=Gluconacetobacter asukensis TaxID=1017181 RepID=A0A7W4IXM5_9PROT|nr:hypothetical protein [Gluconacetobacter asukensis]MBB2170768.1 hypothetical protein [Gluconacetobacter asukensis]
MLARSEAPEQIRSFLVLFFKKRTALPLMTSHTKKKGGAVSGTAPSLFNP